MTTPSRVGRTGVRTGVPAGAAAVAAALAVMGVAVLGTRAAWWRFQVGVQVLRWGAYGAAAATAYTLASVGRAYRAVRPRGAAEQGAILLGLVAVLAAVVALDVVWQWRRRAAELPAAYDITTDLADPPAFAALVARGDLPPAARAYAEDAARVQRRAYGDVGPLVLAAPPGAAFDRALTAARELGWDVVSADREAGRIEATARTFWFGLPEDVVVRVRSAGAESRVDVRSRSRLVRHDLGGNAQRVRKYLARVQAARPGRP